MPAAYVLGLDENHDGRAAAPVDIDGDGDLDLALLTLRGLRLFENPLDERAGASLHFARVRLAGRSPSTAIGATVSVVANGVVHRDHVSLTEGFQTQLPHDLHVGVGSADRIERLEVVWSSGSRDVWHDLPVDRLLLVTEAMPEVGVRTLKRWSDGTRPKPVGAPSTAIDAPRIGGDRGRLAEGSRPTVINFWAPWCAPCNVELPQLVRLAGMYDEEVDFVGVSVERQDLDSVRQTVEQFEIRYPQFLADPEVMTRFFGDTAAAALPSTFVFDQHDQLRRVFRGPITEADLDALLRSLGDEGLFAADLELAARASLQSGDYEKAIEHYRRLADLNPTSAQPLYQMGVAALELGRFDDARQALERAVNRSPTNAMARLQLGVAQLGAGQAGAGFASLQAALQVANGNADVLRALGAAALSAGQLWLAADALGQAVQLEPRSASTWISKGRVHLARGERDQALDAFTQALALTPDDAVAQAAVEQLGAGP